MKYLFPMLMAVTLAAAKGPEFGMDSVARRALGDGLAAQGMTEAELGFYKFYYQMLLHWVAGDNSYRIFCDMKTNRISNQLAEIGRILNRVAVSATVESIQSLPSHEVVLLQLSDFLLGMASTRMNGSAKPGSYKDRLTRYLERKLRKAELRPTGPSESKFNIFCMDLNRGW